MSPFNLVLMAALEVGIWPYPFNGVGTALTALVTQVYLGHRQVCRYTYTIISRS